jgi:hypothetical protein
VSEGIGGLIDASNIAERLYKQSYSNIVIRNSFGIPDFWVGPVSPLWGTHIFPGEVCGVISVQSIRAQRLLRVL